MTLYLDTSLLVAALTVEAETRRMQDWLRRQPVAELAISDWVEAELSAALSMKLRMKRLTVAERDAALDMFSRSFGGTVERLPVSGLQFRTAARFANRHQLGLRGGDALHLAIAADADATLCTLDRKQAEAGDSFGVLTRLV